MNKIDDDLPLEVLTALAEACGFRSAFDRTPGADKWTLSTGHGTAHVQYVGTRKSVCAFLLGYSAMRIQTTQILNELDNAQKKTLLDMRTRLDPTMPPPGER